MTLNGVMDLILGYFQKCGVLTFCGTPTPGFKKIGTLTSTQALKNPQTPTPG